MARGVADDRVLRRSRDGAGGFDELYRRYRDLVLAFHAQRDAEPDVAGDLTAETSVSRAARGPSH
jgi:hypothetical protein